jgi:hypothetical protein
VDVFRITLINTSVLPDRLALPIARLLQPKSVFSSVDGSSFVCTDNYFQGLMPSRPITLSESVHFSLSTYLARGPGGKSFYLGTAFLLSQWLVNICREAKLQVHRRIEEPHSNFLTRCPQALCRCPIVERPLSSAGFPLVFIKCRCPCWPGFSRVNNPIGGQD